MTLRRFSVVATVDAQGDATVTTAKARGMLHSISYVKTDFADGSTFTITGNVSGIALLTETGINASAQRYPRAPTHSNAGVASLYAAAGTAVQDRMPLCGEEIKVVVASGGVAGKVGTFHFVVED